MGISREQALQFISEKKYEKLSFIFLLIFKTYWERPQIIIPSEIPGLNDFIRLFLDIFSREDFIVPPNHFFTYLKLNPILARLTALTNLKSTEGYLKELNKEKQTVSREIDGENNFVKILTLFSAYNQSSPDYQLFFKINPDFASYWYWIYFLPADYISENTWKNLTYHIEKFPEIEKSLTFNFSTFVHEPAFLITYINPSKDKIIKQRLNSLIREKYLPIIRENKDMADTHIDLASPATKKIAVISGLLWPGHAVYKGTYNFIKALSPDYNLTLYLFTGRLPSGYSYKNDSVFQDIKFIGLTEENLIEIIDLIRRENFSMVLFPDIGMTFESMIISNFRLAPVQVIIHGHPVSSFGTEIDYFISGLESENVSTAENNYSERLVLIPGLGLNSDLPAYTQKYLPKSGNDFVIICPWRLPKINRLHLLTLKKISLMANKKITFLFFSNFNNADIILPEKEIKDVLGKDNVIFYGSMPYQQYMSIFEQGDISLDSFHFGGFNTVIDALYLGKPVVTIEGDKAYNKFSAALLRKAGLSHLIAANEQEYIEKIIELVNNDSYLEKVKKQIKDTDLMEKLVESGEPQYFKKAVDYLLENHRQLKAENLHSPIILK